MENPAGKRHKLRMYPPAASFHEHKALFAAFVKAAAVEAAGIDVNPAVIEFFLPVLMNMAERKVIDPLAAQAGSG